MWKLDSPKLTFGRSDLYPLLMVSNYPNVGLIFSAMHKLLHLECFYDSLWLVFPISTITENQINFYFSFLIEGFWNEHNLWIEKHFWADGVIFVDFRQHLGSVSSLVVVWTLRVLTAKHKHHRDLGLKIEKFLWLLQWKLFFFQSLQTTMTRQEYWEGNF